MTDFILSELSDLAWFDCHVCCALFSLLRMNMQLLRADDQQTKRLIWCAWACHLQGGVWEEREEQQVHLQRSHSQQKGGSALNVIDNRKLGQPWLLFIIGRSCLKYHFCRNKSFVTTNICLSLQKNTSFVATKACLLRKIFVTTNTCLSQQIFVATNIFCHAFAELLSWQKWSLWQFPLMVVIDQKKVGLASIVIDNRSLGQPWLLLTKEGWAGFCCRWQQKVWVSHGGYW